MATSPTPFLTVIRSAKPGQSATINDDLTLFRLPKQRFRNGQTYALRHGERTILIDTTHAITRAAVDELLKVRPAAALLITHSDLLGQAFGTPSELSQWLGGVPVLVNSYDIGTHAGLHPIESNTPLLGDLGIAYHHLPGHTPGSTAYLHLPTGYLFAGDAIIGNNYERPGQHFTHAPIADAAWALQKVGWETIPAAGVKAVRMRLHLLRRREWIGSGLCRSNYRFPTTILPVHSRPSLTNRRVR